MSGRAWIISMIVMALAFVGVLWYLYSQVPRVAYVNLSKLYNEFDLKKELEAKLSSTQNMRNNILDSLEIQLKVMSANLQGIKDKQKLEEKAHQFEMYRQEYMMRQQRFTEDNDMTTQKYKEQILTQLNQYVSDYGKEQGYSYVLGADGSGAVMYGSEANDITDAVKKYVNERYRGKK